MADELTQADISNLDKLIEQLLDHKRPSEAQIKSICHKVTLLRPYLVTSTL